VEEAAVAVDTMVLVDEVRRAVTRRLNHLSTPHPSHVLAVTMVDHIPTLLIYYVVSMGSNIPPIMILNHLLAVG
jgi:hypothetical protein